MFFSVPNLRGRMADHHQTLPHVRRWPRFIKFGKKFGWPLPPQFGGPETSKFRRDFAHLRDLIANISGMQQDTVNGHCRNLIRCTLVHKRRNIGPEFWPIQRAAIGLGAAIRTLTFVKFGRPIQRDSLSKSPLLFVLKKGRGHVTWLPTF